MIEIFDVAETFLSLESMTNKKLQKLCYYAQAWHLAINNEVLVPHCEFQAWIHGPVCPELYHKYKHYGYLKIPKQVIPSTISHDHYTKSFIYAIYNTYGNLSADDLEFMTHKELPWINARQGLSDFEPGYYPIDEDDMKSYYSQLLKNN